MAGSARSRKGLLWTLVPVVVLVVVAAIVLVIALRVDQDSDALPEGAVPQPSPASLTPRINPVAADAPSPTPDGVRADLTQALANPDLGQLSGEISDAVSGETLWSATPNQPMVPASTIKVLTASAALVSLPHDKRITTTVVAGKGGQVILVGAGDPTLSVQPAGEETFFTDAPRISDLAEQIKKAGINVTSVAVDTSRFSGPTMTESWDPADIAGGNITPIESLIADSGRVEPLEIDSPRTATPAVTAGAALASELGVDAAVAQATAPAGAQVIAQVESAPLVTRLGDMMRASDNVLAETVSIEIAMATGGRPTMAGGIDAVRKALSDYGFNMNGTVIADVSGLSEDNRVSAGLLDKVVNAGAGTAQPKLRPLLDMLPVAGATGTLAERFATENQAGAGWVRAKTGTLTGASALVGVVQTREGRVLSFALMSNGTSPDVARPALDTIAVALRDCGCR
ncbi:D-alanyl-D-alanine carboxypeptidase/D-alanyl-D-alanine endopeptidase [Williamsia soli]|uniref:D-alanyl-D-alanine carboxypeptidase/D-alanyl-D-alanine endopeptidase n=1 Tax=Williamsia soli TaxID=364929 RepID=UPI0027DBFABE|nr:D-alanyl-D-alanine carboxypeptidase/D-alanyl-D-alanine-endopeptidase [Williamsia soli]